MAKAFVNISRGNNRLEVSAKDNGPHELFLIGAVGGSFWDDSGIKEKEVRDALKSIPKGKPINVHINSEGGSVQEGLGIYNAFKQRSADITAYVDGYALSIASVFPLAASKVVSPKSAIWMIHKPWSDVRGDDDQMEKAAEMLKEHGEMMAEIYAEETGKPIQEWRDAMAKETWIRGSEAVNFGLADETDASSVAASAYRPLPAAYLDRCKNGVAAMGLMFGNHPVSNIYSQFAPAANTPGSVNTQTISAGVPGGARNTHRMDKIKALLKKHGIEVAEDATEETLMAALENIPTTKSDNTDKSGKTIVLDAGLSSQIAAMQKQLAEEKKARVSAALDGFIADMKLTNDERDEELALCMENEARLKTIAKRTPHTISGNSAMGTTFNISAVDPVLDLKTKHPVRAERYKVEVNDWNQILIEACRRDVRSGSVKDPLFAALASAGINPFSNQQMPFPQNANTITSVLTSFLMDGSVTDLQNRWAMLRAFSMDTRPDGYKPLAPGILKHVTAFSTAQTDPTSYESGNSTVAPVTVTPHEHSVSYQISNIDLNSGVRMQDLVTGNTANFANVVIEAAIAPISVANFGAATVIRAAELFSFTDLATLQAALKKSSIKNLIIDGSYIARISNVPGFFQVAGTVGGSPQAWKPYGWDGIYNNTDWTGSAANAQGFACNPQAIGGIIGLPILPSVNTSGVFSSSTMTVDGLDIQVLAEAWFNPATRTSWNSLRCIDGFAKVDATAGFILTSA
jgi:ATP-dependent protease ClpP protease subunit